jgi:hypothetical protein
MVLARHGDLLIPWPRVCRGKVLMSAVFDFKSIRIKLERLEQKDEFEEKNARPR